MILDANELKKSFVQYNIKKLINSNEPFMFFQNLTASDLEKSRKKVNDKCDKKFIHK